MAKISPEVLKEALASAADGCAWMAGRLKTIDREIIFAAGLANFFGVLAERTPEATLYDMNRAMTAYARKQAARFKPQPNNTGE